MNVAERDEVGIIDGGSNHENKTVKTSPFKNLNKATG